MKRMLIIFILLSVILFGCDIKNSENRKLIDDLNNEIQELNSKITVLEENTQLESNNAIEKEIIKTTLTNCIESANQKKLKNNEYHFDGMNCEQYPKYSESEVACQTVLSRSLNKNEEEFKYDKEECYRRYEIELNNL